MKNLKNLLTPTKIIIAVWGTALIVLSFIPLGMLVEAALITDEDQRDRSPASHCINAVVESSENPETTVATDVMQIMDDRAERSWVILVKSYDDSQSSSEENFFKCGITRFDDITGIAPVTPNLAQRMIDKQSATG